MLECDGFSGRKIYNHIHEIFGRFKSNLLFTSETHTHFASTRYSGRMKVTVMFMLLRHIII